MLIKKKTTEIGNYKSYSSCFVSEGKEEEEQKKLVRWNVEHNRRRNICLCKVELLLGFPWGA